MLERPLALAENHLQNQPKFMGKKRIIQKTEEELLKETEKVEGRLTKETKVRTLVKAKEGRVYIYSSYNNTIINLSDSQGNVLTWFSAGSLGFKGTKKATPFAASRVAQGLCTAAKKIGVEKVALFVKGIGSGRDSAIRSLASHGLEIVSIKDITPIPHNGCRPPKARRV